MMTIPGGAGYKLNLEKNHLSFFMMHSWPYTTCCMWFLGEPVPG